MSSSKMSRTDYYNHLSHLYVDQIAKSGMLLDEDLDFLLASCDLTSDPRDPKPDWPIGLIAGVSSLAACYIFVKTFNASSAIFLTPPAVLTGATVIKELIRQKKKRDHRQLINELINCLKSCSNVNKKFYKYIKTRQMVAEKSEVDFFKTLNDKIHESMLMYSKNNLVVYNCITQTMERILVFCPDLKADYQYYKSFDPKEFTKMTLDVLQFLETWHDVQVLLSSNLLSYLGVLFGSKISKLDLENLKLFLDVWIPELNRSINKTCKDNTKIFTTLKESGLSLEKVIATKKPDEVTRQFVSAKLNNSLESTLYNIYFIAEKTRNILEVIDNDSANKECLNRALLDLRDHTLATYESLDVLCKLYGIASSKTTVLQDSASSTIQPIAVKSDTTNELKTINYDDPDEAVEERYELYLDKEANEEENEPYIEASSDNYVGLMLQELRQSLKQHERFKEARRRRGSEDQEEEEVEIENEKYFDLDRLKTKKHRSGVPPPPPPPSDVSGDRIEKDWEWKSNMLANIRMLSGQRKVQEETFGEILSDEDNDIYVDVHTDDDDDDDDD